MNYNYFMLVPLNLVYDEEYADLSVDAILIYSLLLNRTRFSMQNKKFKDEKGVFVCYSTSRISRQLNCSVNSVKKRFQELEKAELIKREYQKSGLPVKFYVNDVFQMLKGANSYQKQEKEVSFDVEKSKEMELRNLYNFAEKRKKRKKSHPESNDSKFQSP